MASAGPVRFTLRLVNKLPTPRVVILEPWTGEYHLAGSTTLDITVEGSPKTPLESSWMVTGSSCTPLTRPMPC